MADHRESTMAMLARIKATIAKDDEEGLPTDYLCGYFIALKEELEEEIEEERNNQQKTDDDRGKSNDQTNKTTNNGINSATNKEDEESVSTFQKILDMDLSDDKEKDDDKDQEDDDKDDDHDDLFKKLCKERDESEYNDVITQLKEYETGMIVLHYGRKRRRKIHPNDRHVPKPLKQTTMKSFFGDSENNKGIRKDG